MPTEAETSQIEETSRFDAYYHKIEESALKLIARAEQTNLGLTAKLERKGFEAPIIKTVVSDLLERGLLNDERYALLWLRSRIAKKSQSPKMLLASLRKKFIDQHSSISAIKKALDPDSEYALLLRYLEIQENPDSITRAKLRYENFSNETLDRHFSEK